MDKIKLVVIGAGLRGMHTYGDFIEKHNDICEVVAVVESKKGRQDTFKKRFDLCEDNVFNNIEEFFENKKMADVIIICNYDSLHFKTASLALEKGYNVLIEGPICNSLDEVIRLEELCSKHNDLTVFPAMTYRHSRFFNKIKEIIDSKPLGELININYNSYIGYEKFTHNYIRGNWRIESDCATLMLTNSCYDLDMLIYLSNSKCKKISSFGKLSHFNRQQFKDNMGETCSICIQNKECPYCAENIYLNEKKEISKAIHINPTKENLQQALKQSQYGRCVYHCDNDVYDNVLSILKFENSISASLNVTAFTNEEEREIRLNFSKGEIIGSLKNMEIRVKKFGSSEELIKLGAENSDWNMINNFLDIITNKRELKSNKDISEIFHSHIVAFASEFANISDSVVDVDNFYMDSVELTKSMISNV